LKPARTLRTAFIYTAFVKPEFIPYVQINLSLWTKLNHSDDTEQNYTEMAGVTVVEAHHHPHCAGSTARHSSSGAADGCSGAGID
jgi:hypothetical protein